MTWSINLNPGEHAVTAQNSETVLEAALREGFIIPHGCRSGACGSCKGQILEGLVDFGPYQSSALTEEEKSEGYALLCCAKPLSNLNVQCQELRKSNGVEIKTLPARVQSLKRLADDVMIMSLKLPAGEPFAFEPGQYIDILLKEGMHRSFSLANTPSTSEFLELHIRGVTGGQFTSQVFNEMKEKTILRIRGPLGTFHFHEENNKPVIFMAGGTGFAPIKSIIESNLSRRINHEMVLYWGTRSLKDLYMPHLPSAWQTENPNFTFIPVLSQPQPSDSWHGRIGYVHQAIIDDFSDLSRYQVYACGSPEMIDTGRTAFISQGLDPEEYYTDSFIYQSNPVAV